MARRQSQKRKTHPLRSDAKKRRPEAAPATAAHPVPFHTVSNGEASVEPDLVDDDNGASVSPDL